MDFLIGETMSTSVEARAAITGVTSVGKPVWVAWTIADDDRPGLRSGETLAEAWAPLDVLPVSGLLLNCSASEAITAAMSVLGALSNWPVGGYVNCLKTIPKKLVRPRRWS